jgi:hypothetical protein
MYLTYRSSVHHQPSLPAHGLHMQNNGTKIIHIRSFPLDVKVSRVGDNYCKAKRSDLIRFREELFHRSSMLPIQHVNVTATPSLQPLFDTLSQRKLLHPCKVCQGAGKAKPCRCRTPWKSAVEQPSTKELIRYISRMRNITLTNRTLPLFKSQELPVLRCLRCQLDRKKVHWCYCMI